MPVNVCTAQLINSLIRIIKCIPPHSDEYNVNLKCDKDREAQWSQPAFGRAEKFALCFVHCHESERRVDWRMKKKMTRNSALMNCHNHK